VRALDVLAFIPVVNEPLLLRLLPVRIPADQDGDGCDTRAVVLIRQSTSSAQVDPVGCTVVEVVPEFVEVRW
jgi:hypothetical protein